MTTILDRLSPATPLMEDVLRKINALGSQPRVIVEFDKFSYVPGLKSKFSVWDHIMDTSITHVQAESVDSPSANEPTGVVSGGESGERFEYIKCAFNRQMKAYNIPKEGYYFLLAVAKHETAFGTLGQGRPEKGSFIVGYGCPGSCDFTYSGIDTQAKYAAKRYSEAMKSKMGFFTPTKPMSANDVDYFHEGGDKGYGKWVWSADGANWKKRVKQFYDQIRSEDMSLGTAGKWACTDNSGTVPMSTVDNSEIATVSDAHVPPAFPIEGLSFSGDAKMSSPRGMRWGSMHKGIDITTKSAGSAGVNGKWVLAAWDGEVIKSKKMTGFGNCVWMKHPNGYGTVYAHMQDGSLQTKQGQTIKAGTRLGKVGTTGDSTAPHLHFEIWINQYNSANGTGHIDPYPILTGAQKVEGLSGNTGAPMEVTENVVFNKCFGKSGDVGPQWEGKENIEHFHSTTTGEKYIGFKNNITKGETKDFGFKHNFSADGFYQLSYFCRLKKDDVLRIALDGVTVKLLTEADNNTKVTMMKPIYVGFVTGNTPGVNSHILSFTLTNNSGLAAFGIGCFKVAEIETKNGSQTINQSVTARKRDLWIDTGGFVFDKTFTIEDEVTAWEVNTHFDQTTATARITLDNHLGVFSPTYQRTDAFPDNLREAEMSYYENGMLRHVLSEATPVRVYAGYGENVVRVFTGMIKGEIEEDSEGRTVTVNCVDMYDMLNEHVFETKKSYPDEAGDTTKVMWVMSSIIHNIVSNAGMASWRVVSDDLLYPDIVIEETYYIDIDKGGKSARVWDAKTRQYVVKKIATVKDLNGYKNPYVQPSISFDPGTRAADAIQTLLGDIMYRSYCDRYGTFRLENIRNITAENARWEFIDGENLHSLSTAIDHSRVRNHLMVAGNRGQVEHFVDKDLTIAIKGNMRSAQIVADWVDESYGATSRGIKEDIANKIFFDMKRQARTFSVIVKGNPLIEVLDGCYVYDANTSNLGYYVIKGNRLSGDAKGMVNQLELTWQDTESYYNV